MKITYSSDRFEGERVLDTVPRMSLRVDEQWYRRPHIYQGRALTDSTLIRNAQHHIRHLQLFGQHLSSGVIQGLEVSHYQRGALGQQATEQSETWLKITPGIGLTHKGDDLLLSNLTHVALKEVYTVGSIEQDEIESETVADRLIQNRLLKQDLRNPKRFYLTLYSRSRDLVEQRLEKLGVTKPAPILSAWDKTRVTPSGPGILVLEPIELIDEFNEDVDSQCQWDSEQDAFDDERLIDGCRLVFYPWPANELGPAPASDDSHLRNKLAYQVFDYEQRQYQKQRLPHISAIPVTDSDVYHCHKQYQPYVPLPWEHYGVALAMADINDAGIINFLDSYAVRRKGGAPLTVKPIIELNGSPFLWEARIQQFVEHMHDLARDPDKLPHAYDYFDVLPPVGLLPRQMINFDEMYTGFFPSQFLVEAAPIPEEQLEVAMNASASLEPFDVYRPERVKLLVPLPQEVFEPDLLKKEKPDPIFLSTIRQLVFLIRQILDARNQYRGMASKVIGAIDWDDVPVFTADQDAIPDELKFPIEQPAVPTINFAVQAKNAIQKLAQWIHQNATMDNDSDYQLLAKTNKIGTAEFPGLEEIIVSFQHKIDKTELYLSSGFLRAEADIYRLRQLMLGSEQASRLATSPVVGQIVEGYTRVPTVADLQGYFARAVSKEEPEAEPPAAEAEPPAAEAELTAAEVTETGDTVISERLALSENVRIAAIDTSMLPLKYMTAYKKYNEPYEIEMVKATSRSKKIVDRVYESPATEVKKNTVKTKSTVFESFVDVPLDMQDETVIITSSESTFMSKDKYDDLVESLQDNGQSTVKSNMIQNRAEEVSGQFVKLLTTPLSSDEKTALGDQGAIDQVETKINENRGKTDVSIKDANLAGAIRQGLLDPDPTDGDEANYFSVGVEVLENVLANMRRVELRLDAYRKALAQSKHVLKRLQQNASKWRAELSEQDNKLTEARHDVLVARSLYEEERTRVEAINQHRLQILEKYVTSLAYVRPRLVEARIDAPSVKLRKEYVSPVPACLREDYEAGDELRDMLDVFREVPVNWFVNAKPLVALLKHPAQMIEVFEHALQRSQQKLEMKYTAQSVQSYQGQAMAVAVSQVVTSQQAFAQQYHNKRMTMDVASLKAKSWKDLRYRAEKELSLADLIESGKGNSLLARKAATVMENMEDIAVCLYQRCNEITPAIRLRWADKLSIFDDPVDLQQLDSMPGWDEFDYEFRRDLQNLVDWLFSQVEPTETAARKLINDLVRVCILLASHAPVSSIIRGYVPRPVTGRIGDIIDVAIAKGKVRVGMIATIMNQDKVLAQGVVEDVAAGAASMKLTAGQGIQNEVVIGQEARVMFRQPSKTKKAGQVMQMRTW